MYLYYYSTNGYYQRSYFRSDAFGCVSKPALDTIYYQPCRASAPSNTTKPICTYTTIAPMAITRGVTSVASHLYNYWIYSPNNPNGKVSAIPIAKVSSTSSNFNPKAYLPSTLTATNYQFWIAEYDSTDKCLGGAAEVILTVNATSAPVAPSDTAFCQALHNSQLLLVTNVLPQATSVDWYDSTATLIATGDDYSNSLWKGTSYTVAGTNTLKPGTYRYRVSQTVQGCQSPKVVVSFKIYPKPVPPMVTSNSSCQGLVFKSLTASSLDPTAVYNYKWYANAQLQPVPLASNVNSYIPTIINTTGPTTLYVTQTSQNACTSDAQSTVYTVYAHPSTPIFQDSYQTMCATATVVPTFTVTNATGTIE